MTVKRLIIFTGYFPPAYKAGGPIQSIAAIVEYLAPELDIHVVCLDTDKGDTVPLPGVIPLVWTQHGRAKVMYIPRRILSFRWLRQMIEDVQPDTVYLQSIFDVEFSIPVMLMHRFGLLPKLRLVLAPRGDLSAGRLSQKWHKRMYLRLFGWLGMHRYLIFHSTSDNESSDIRALLAAAGMRNHVHIEQVMPIKKIAVSAKIARIKTPGSIDIAFLSRITEKKNLHMVLGLLREVTGNVTLHIYGPIVEESYWQKCQQIIVVLPQNVQVLHHGALPHDEVAKHLSQHQFFVLPTLGENFGHVIVEALACGLPCVLSDATPFQFQASQAGWAVPLADKARWLEVLKLCVMMDNDEYQTRANAATNVAESYSTPSPEILDEYKALFSGDASKN